MTGIFPLRRPSSLFAVIIADIIMKTANPPSTSVRTAGTDDFFLGGAALCESMVCDRDSPPIIPSAKLDAPTAKKLVVCIPLA